TNVLRNSAVYYPNQCSSQFLRFRGGHTKYDKPGSACWPKGTLKMAAYVNSPDKSWPAPALAITLLLAVPAAATIYGWLAYLVNRTTIRVDPGRVYVR